MSDEHRADRWLTAVVLATLIVCLLLQIFVLRDWEDHWYGIGFDYFKLAVLFFLAGKLVETVMQLTREARDIRGIVGFFGLERAIHTKPVCFVLPVFEATKRTAEFRAGPPGCPPNWAPVGLPAIKELADSRTGTLVIEDVLASIAVSAMLGKAGVNRFAVMDDGHFLWWLAQQSSPTSQQTSEVTQQFDTASSWGSGRISSVVSYQTLPISQNSPWNRDCQRRPNAH